MADAGQGFQEIICKKPVPDLDSLKGLKLKSYGPIWPKVLADLDATGVSIPGAELYEALSRGTLDGAIFYISFAEPTKVSEVTKHYTWDSLRGAGIAGNIIINWEFFQSLPEDIQKILRDTSEEVTKDMYELDRDAAIAAKGSLITNTGATFYEWTQEDKDRLASLVTPYWTEWAKKMDAEGQPGSKALELFLKHLAKYEQ